MNLFELLEVRKMLEPKAAGLAAVRADIEQLREIERERVAVEASANDWEAAVQHNFRFHAAIVRTAGNPVLEQVYRGLTQLMFQSGQITTSSDPEMLTMHKDHNAIMELIGRGESEAAEKAMLEHLHNVGLDLIAERKR